MSLEAGGARLAGSYPFSLNRTNTSNFARIEGNGEVANFYV